MADAGDDSARAGAYFRAIEETFVRLRGAPLLLSPADWQLAREWQRAGIPLDLVCRALEEVFARRRDRQARGKVQGLRYCRHAVEAAWQEVQDLSAVGTRATALPMEVAPRLARLAERLPPRLAGRRSWAERIRALDGSAERVEEVLAALDEELLAAAWETLDAASCEEIDSGVDRALAALSQRLSEEEREALRWRLRRQELRRRLELPLLSLFAPEAAEAQGQEPPGSPPA